MEESEEVKEFKHKCIVEFLQEMINYSHGLGMKNSLCILPSSTMQESWFKELAILDNLDNFGTDPYWYAFKRDVKEFVGDFSRKVNKVCTELNRDGHIWIQGFKVPGGREEEIQTAVTEAVESGIRDLAVWGFDACSYISHIAPDNPQKAWDIVCRAFEAVKDLE